MQEIVPYIPIDKSRGFTAHIDNIYQSTKANNDNH